VGDGAAAVARLYERTYDLVLMDMQMPGTGGIEATRIIRRDPVFQNVPIIAMTANAMESDRQACLEAGMNDHIGKPVDPDELYTVLEGWADRIAARNEPRTKAAPVARVEPSNDPLAGDPGLQSLERVIDVRAGLGRALNRTEFFRSLLRSYLASQRDLADQIRVALKKGEDEEAQRHAHTGNGLAGQIGAESVRAAAEWVESAMRDGRPEDEIEAGLRRLENALSPVMLAIEAMLAEAPETAHSAAPAGDLVTLTRVAALLSEDDPKARTLWQEHAGAFTGLLGETTHRSISAAIERFDFEVAHDALHKALAVADVR
jgi:CheY-like chemotaxis protein